MAFIWRGKRFQKQPLFPPLTLHARAQHSWPPSSTSALSKPLHHHGAEKLCADPSPAERANQIKPQGFVPKPLSPSNYPSFRLSREHCHRSRGHNPGDADGRRRLLQPLEEQRRPQWEGKQRAPRQVQHLEAPGKQQTDHKSVCGQHHLSKDIQRKTRQSRTLPLPCLLPPLQPCAKPCVTRPYSPSLGLSMQLLSLLARPACWHRGETPRAAHRAPPGETSSCPLQSLPVSPCHLPAGTGASLPPQLPLSPSRAHLRSLCSPLSMIYTRISESLNRHGAAATRPPCSDFP